jgi:hypothetical protein
MNVPITRALIVVLLTVTSWPMMAQAQNIQAYAIASKFSATDKVLELTIPAELDGERFVIVWTSGADQSLALRVARAGTHSYEMRHLPKWTGSVDVVATNLQVTGRVKTPTFSDEIDMFLEPERITPSTVNGVMVHTLFGMDWHVVLLVVFAASGLFIALFKKKRPAVALTLGFVVAWAAMDARSTYDDAVIITKGHRATGVQMFSDRAAEIIGHGTWGAASLDATIEPFLRYRLAETPYIPAGSSGHPDFWFTTNSNDGQVLVQFSNYYLVKKTQP